MHHTIFSTIFCIDKPRGSHSYLFIAFCPQQRQDSGGTSHKCPLAPPADTFSLTCPLLSSTIAQQSSPGFLSCPFSSLISLSDTLVQVPISHEEPGASPALLGSTHSPWSCMGKQMRCHQHQVSVQPLVLLISTSSLTFSAQELTAEQGTAQGQASPAATGYNLSNITNPMPTCIEEGMNTQESLKGKCCLISYLLSNTEMIFMSHKWDFTLQVIEGNNISRTHFT